mgnify:FL=1
MLSKIESGKILSSIQLETNKSSLSSNTVLEKKEEDKGEPTLRPLCNGNEDWRMNLSDLRANEAEVTFDNPHSPIDIDNIPRADVYFGDEKSINLELSPVKSIDKKSDIGSGIESPSTDLLIRRPGSRFKMNE